MASDQISKRRAGRVRQQRWEDGASVPETQGMENGGYRDVAKVMGRLSAESVSTSSLIDSLCVTCSAREIRQARRKRYRVSWLCCCGICKHEQAA